MLKSKIFLICLLMLLLIFPISCKSPTSPDPIDPWKYGGEIEIMYVRVKEVVYPNEPDPTSAAIYHNKYGGQNSSRFVLVEENKWLATISLNCEPQPYYIWTRDLKITGIYRHVGEKFFLRLKKEGAGWVELTCIGASPYDPEGKASKFKFYNGQIQNPTGCSNS